MTREGWVHVKNLFHQALELSGPDRSRYLDSACDDPFVREEVERLIANCSVGSDFLEHPVSVFGRVIESMANPVNVFKDGDVINDRFHIIRFIGAGGMGEVYEATDAAIGGVHVALKTIRSVVGVSPEVDAQLRREVQMARTITHPNACRIHDLFETRVEDQSFGGTRTVLFFTMEFLEGESLAERLARSGPLPKHEALPLINDIVQALTAAHEHGIIHRDMKASNVMLVRKPDGSLKAVITDFGLACHERRRDANAPDEAVAGTPDYMAPELLTGGQPSQASDIFATGVVICEMLTGQRPFEGSSTLTGAVRRSTSAKSPRAKIPEIDPKWERIISRCLAHDLDERFANAPELMEALVRPSRQAKLTRRAAIAAGVLGAAGLGAWLSRKGGAAEISSIAVLPFDNFSGDKDVQYFSEGLTSDLVPLLTRFPGLRVIAPSPFQLKAFSHRDAVGRELGVQALLTGSVRRDGTRINVTARVANVADGMAVWSGAYSEDIRNIVRIRLNLSMEISAALQPRLGHRLDSRIGVPQLANAEAYNLYLAGKHYATFRSGEGLKQAIDCLQQSVAIDANFAPAHAALSDAYGIRAGQLGCPPAEYIEKAKEAAIRALRLDSQSGEAHTALGFAYGRQWNWAESEREFQLAIRLNPGLAIAHYRYAGLHSVLGRPLKALEEAHVARDRDPLSQVFSAGYGAFLYRARRYDEAVAHLNEILRSFPDSASALSDLGQVLDSMGRYAEAVATHRKALETGPGFYFRYASRLGHALAKSGDRENALKIADDLKAGLGTSHYSPMGIANVYLGLGENDSAFFWYDKAVQARDPSMEVINVDPVNDPIRMDPRFGQMLRRVGLS